MKTSLSNMSAMGLELGVNMCDMDWSSRLSRAGLCFRHCSPGMLDFRQYCIKHVPIVNMNTLPTLCHYAPLIRLRHSALYECVFDLIRFETVQINFVLYSFGDFFCIFDHVTVCCIDDDDD